MKYTILILFLSCGMLASKELLKLSDRTLLIDPHGRGLIYPYNEYECKFPKRVFNKKCSWVRKEIIYDLKDENVIRELSAAEFVCKSKHHF